MRRTELESKGISPLLPLRHHSVYKSQDGISEKSQESTGATNTIKTLLRDLIEIKRESAVRKATAIKEPLHIHDGLLSMKHIQNPSCDLVSANFNS